MFQCSRLAFVPFQLTDSSKNKHKPRCQVFLLDLNLEPARRNLVQLLKDQSVAAVHVALPCGTGSRARERPIPQHLIKQGAPTPMPLRDAQNLLGLPNLSDIDASREFSKPVSRVHSRAH